MAGPSRSTRALAVLLLFGALALPARAGPPITGTASVVGSTLSFSAATGETNRVSVSTDGNQFYVTDNGTPLSAGPGCTANDANSATCTGVVTQVQISLGDGNDRADLSGVPLCAPNNPGCDEPEATIRGGDGDDVLTGGGGDDLMEGEGGSDSLLMSPNDDRMFGGTGIDVADYSAAGEPVVVTLNNSTADDGRNGIEFDDTRTEVVIGGSADDRLTGGSEGNGLQGGRGDDTLDGGAGPDDLTGGEGFDTADYSARSSGVAADLEGDADDGESGEADLVRADVESLRGGAGNDALTGAAGADTIYGGYGRDSIEGGPGDDLLFGEEDNDALRGGDGEDSLQAGRGEDYLEGGGGPDLLTGGEGTDTVDYSGRTRSLLVDFYSAGLDGEPGENDIVRPDIEVVEGGPAADKFTAQLFPVTLNGNGGDDTLQGGAGDDLVNGGAGKDTAAGGGGFDTVTGGAGQDAMSGGNGDDTLLARDGAKDTIACGAGADMVQADGIDVIESDCDKIDRKVGPSLTLPSGRLKLRKGMVRVRVGCPRRTVGNCTGTITIQGRKPRRRYGRKAFTVAAGKARSVPVRISSAGQKRIAAEGNVACTLVVTARDGAGNRSAKRRSITLF